MHESPFCTVSSNILAVLLTSVAGAFQVNRAARGQHKPRRMGQAGHWTPKWAKWLHSMVLGSPMD